MVENVVAISGHALTIGDAVACASEPQCRVALTDGSRSAIARGHRAAEAKLTSEVVYGVNTGFGPMASRVLARDELVDLQYNLLRSHACGVGDPIEARFVIAAMLVRLNTLAHGVSGVS